jgi:hypothetical protein
MPKTKTFQVKEGRIFFICSSCRAKRMVSVPFGSRRRSVRCQKCGEALSCVLNRRQMERNQQRGRVQLFTNESNTEVDLFDISMNGVGFELDVRSGLKITVGREVHFKCGWNSRLFSQERYVVKTIRGSRIGVERRN